MGKAEVGTPKYLANKMKSKGLQKLRWYCQMCQKQCRDDNGFKCHIMSESHQRQMRLFSDNAGRMLDSFSQEFSKGFMYLVKRQHGTKRVLANKVYQDYISDKHHLHMNATKWQSLSAFVQWLGRTGQCKVEESEKGWYITYIDRDPETLERMEKRKRKEKQEKDDEDRLQEYIRGQVERAKAAKPEDEEESEKFTELVRQSDDEPLRLDIRLEKKPKVENLMMPPPAKRPVVDEAEERKFKRPKAGSSKDEGRKLTALDEIIAEEETKKERTNRKDYWLREGIVVKVVAKSLGDKFYKQKAVVYEVVDKYAAKVKLLEGGEKLKVDQAHLETVIPNIGKPVAVLNGAYRGSTATLKSLEADTFSVTIEIAHGPLKGRVVSGVQYEDISKLHV